nr:hypothetical protein [Tanacetum cinerariifolium]
TEHLTIQVIDRGGEKQQRTDRPAVFADGLADHGRLTDALRMSGLVQVHGITLLFGFG